MIPLKDENPTSTAPVITLVLIAACVVIYFFVQSPNVTSAIGGTQSRSDQAFEVEFTYRRAAIPCEVVTGKPLSPEEIASQDCTRRDPSPPVFPQKSVLAALFTSMFLHGSLIHLAGNMLFLWVFGNNIEDTRGKVMYLLFYLVAGVVATLAHVGIQPGSTIPLVGASGAIAGVMGAYLVLFPRVPIRTLIIFYFIMFRDIEARWLLAIWFVMQFFVNPNAGVAWAAHVGGFVFGVLVGLVWRARGPRRPVRAAYAT